MSYQGPRRTGRPHATSHAGLAAVVLRLFREHGYRAVSVQRIADSAGIGRSTFFGYFTSKQDLVTHCQASQFAVLEQRLRAAPPDADPFAFAARALIAVVSDVGLSESTTVEDYAAVLMDAAELRAAADSWAQRRAAVIAEFVAARIDPASRELLPLAYALALNGALAAAAAVFGRSGTRAFGQILEEAVAPVVHGYAASVPSVAVPFGRSSPVTSG